jgi:N-acetylmuramoyl-L-alanine amidase
MAKTVFLNAGHGGSDPGAIGNGFKEKDLNLSITLACRDVLEKHGVKVVMGRTKDVDTHSSGILNACNNSKADLAIDIHNNAGGGDGAEVFYHHGGGVGKTLATNIIAEIKAVGQNSRGIKTKKNSSGTDYYYFIRQTTPPAVIVECAFVDNKNDIKIINTATKQKTMGVAIAKGILKTLGIEYKTAVSKPATNEKIYRVQVGAFTSKAAAQTMQAKLKAAGYDTIIV